MSSAAEMELTGDWLRATRIVDQLADSAMFDELGDHVLRSEAKFAASEMRRGIRSGAPGGKRLAPLSPATLLARRLAGISSSAPLIATGLLLSSITTVRASRREYWAGFPDKTTRGRNPAMIMAVNEYGQTRVQRVTPRMRGMLGVMFGRAPAVGTLMTIRIRPRPVVGPVYESKFTPDRARARVRGRVTQWLNQHGL